MSPKASGLVLGVLGLIWSLWSALHGIRPTRLLHKQGQDLIFVDYVERVSVEDYIAKGRK